jgi:Ca-activated chloride channel family protein
MSEWLNSESLMRIESPWFLLVLIPIIIAGAMALWQRPPTLVVSFLEPYRKSMGGRGNVITPLKLPVLFECIGLIMLVVALIRPQFGTEEDIIRAEGIDIILALDISGSMEAFDVAGSKQDAIRQINDGTLKPRIDVAKAEVERFIEGRKNDRIGLLAFSGETYTVCPPTLDHDFLKLHLARLEAGTLSEGTGVAAPITTGTYRLKDSDAERRVLVLFTDGDNNIEAKVSPLQAAKLAAMFDVIVYTVGIGSDSAWGIATGFFGRRELRPFPTTLNDELLTDIAEATDGRYFKAADARGLELAMKEIDELETTEVEQPRYIDYSDLFPGWLYAGCLFILLGFAAEHSLLVRVP